MIGILLAYSLSFGCMKKTESHTKSKQVDALEPIDDTPDMSAQMEAASFDKGSIDAKIKTKMESFHNCYIQSLQKKTDLHGRLMVQFEIAQNGSVLSATVIEDTTGYQPLKNCILDQFRALTFPAGMKSDMVQEGNEERNVIVSYPFLFESE